jgi:murein DD-endopeptidase MepM/ murein hydrolase activator NlpD
VIDVVDRANGWVVTIEATSGMVAVYRHLQTVSVSKGATVTGGDGIGIVGHTTETSLVHLHFELHVNRYALQHNYRGSLNPEPHMVWEAV